MTKKKMKMISACLLYTSPYKYDGILGVKTGNTNAARGCLVAAAERGGMTLIGVVYTSEPETLYPDMIKLLDFGFDNFKPVDLGIEAGSVVGKASVKGGKKRNVDVTVRYDVRATAELMADGTCLLYTSYGLLGFQLFSCLGGQPVFL